MSANEELSHAEIWDDTELLDSWNAAYEEYKKYHSLHKQGILVEEVLQTSDEATVNGNMDHRMNGELDETFEMEEDAPHDLSLHRTGAADYMHASGVQASPEPPPSSIPHTLLGQGSDEGLKNLMISWYYAGYYTGLHEGQQKALPAQTMPKQVKPLNQATARQMPVEPIQATSSQVEPGQDHAASVQLESEQVSEMTGQTGIA